MGEIFQAAGAVAEGEAQYKAAKYNAALARKNASYIRGQSISDAYKSNIEGRKQIGEMRASYAASGVTIEGSAFDVLQESARAAKQDEMNLRYQGERQAQAVEQGATLTEFEGKMAKTMGYVKAAGHVASGASKAMTAGVG